MPRAPKKCNHPDCETRVVARTYCDEHKPINWAKGPSRTSTTAHRAWRTAVLRRCKGVCEIRGPGCTYRAFEADHIEPVSLRPDLEFNLDNGQGACPTCHRAKSLIEATIARRAARGPLGGTPSPR